MEPTPPTTTDPPPRRRWRWKWILIALFAVFAIAVVAIISDRSSALPVSISFVNTVNDYHPPTVPDVPCIAIVGLPRTAIEFELQLERESNGAWMPWPDHIDATNALRNVRMAGWKIVVQSNAQVLTHPPQHPGIATTNLLRVHGFAAREKQGLSALPAEIVYQVKRRFYKPPPPIVVTNMLPGSPLPSGYDGYAKTSSGIYVLHATPKPPEKPRPFHYPTFEFVTSPFTITEPSTALTISITNSAK